MTELLTALLRGAVKRNVPLTCAYYLLDDWRARRRLARGDLGTRGGNAHASFDLTQSLAYLDRVYRDYLGDAGIAGFSGTVCEIGPGDSFGIAVLMLAGGATSVHAIDRYSPDRDTGREADIYRALAQRPKVATVFDGDPAGRIPNLTYRSGIAAEDYFGPSAPMFDAIVSRAVLEHLYDPILALERMYTRLRPGGILVHRIDLRDHGMFGSRHPLTLLTVPEAIYPAMTQGSGRPNRLPLSTYRDWARRAGSICTTKVNLLVGETAEFSAAWADLPEASKVRALARVEAIRPQLSTRFRSERPEDLAVAAFVLIVRKPAA